MADLRRREFLKLTGLSAAALATRLNAEEDEPVWNAKYCKGCSICINECTSGALTQAYELDFEDGVVRLEKPF